VLAMKESQISR
ncbi:ftsZ family, C-terminal domain protein, partial [Vibrio parahaemolyticus V-223/04]